MNVGSLFTGIGGFDLGLERAGMRVVWQSEQDEFCRRVLARHWPGVPCYPDVRALVADTELTRLEGRGDGTVRAWATTGGGEGPLPVPVPPVDVLCGGFPCQDISLAGKGAGIDGARSGLWGEYARLVGELRPRYVIVENVAALLARGLDRVLGDLAALGYDAEWDCLPASAFGAPHRRDRLWLVAYPNGESEPGCPVDAESGRGLVVSRGTGASAADTDGGGREAWVVADADQERRRERTRTSDHDAGRGQPTHGGSGGSEWWAVEPPVGRVAHGIPDRLDQLAALGNALVPQIAEWLGRRILEAEAMNEQRAA